MAKELISILDKMPIEEKNRYIEKTRRRLSRNTSKASSVSPEVFLIAEFGYYFGWSGVQAIRHNEILLEEVVALLDGAKKVWASKMVDYAHSTMIGNSFKTQATNFNDAVKPFTDKADL